MEKIPTDISTSESIIAPTASTETRTLREVVYGSKRIGGSYGSLAKSQLQPTFYISHNVEPDDTLQRLALKYSINVCIYFLHLYHFFLLSIKDSRNKTS